MVLQRLSLYKNYRWLVCLTGQTSIMVNTYSLLYQTCKSEYIQLLSYMGPVLLDTETLSFTDLTNHLQGLANIATVLMIFATQSILDPLTKFYICPQIRSKPVNFTIFFFL